MEVERSGSWTRVVVCGAVDHDGTKLMRTYDTFNVANFALYIELARRKRGRVMLITDNA